jgi:hypothetical protein
MISDLAISEIERLQKSGLKPTVADIIRLNALGLKVEYSQRSGDIYALPRVAYLGEIHFAEPSVGHDIWITEALEHVDRSHYPTFLAVNAYALSRPLESLVDAKDKAAVRLAVDGFLAGPLAPFTFHQIRVAVMYALYGSSQLAKEYPEADDGADEKAIFENAPRAVGAGVIVSTMALSLGLTVQDVMKLTVAQVYEIQTLALMKARVDLAKTRGNEASDAFFRTVAAVEERLKAEKEKNHGG